MADTTTDTGTPTTPAAPSGTGFDLILKADLGNGTMPDEFARTIIQQAPKSSALLQRARTVPMSKKTRKQPVLDMFPEAYWVEGETGLKQTTKAKWGDLKMTAEELAVIVPVPENLLADSEIRIFDEVAPRVAESMGKMIDQAALFGVGKPDSWPEAIVPAAVAAGNTVKAGTGADLAVDVASMGQKLSEQGYVMEGFVSQPGLDWQLRALRSASGAPIYQDSLAAAGPSTLYGHPLNPVANGAWDGSKALLVGADWSNVLVGIRQDVTVKVLDQAVISDADGKVLLNLAQQDAVALRFVMRVGFCVANPLTRLQGAKDKRYPACVLAPAAAK